jgi:cytochrome c oxidase assembly factor CtaG
MSLAEAVLGSLPAAVAAAAWWWAYRRRARTLAGQGRAVPRWRQVCFAAGLLVATLAVCAPVDEISLQLLIGHMAQHLLLADLAALLLVLGLTGPLLGPVLALPVLGRLRALAHPLVALPLWALDLYLWHLPALYQAALRHPGIHVLEHAMFLAFGLNMWMALLGPLPKPPWFGNLARLGYIVAVRLAGAVLANVLLWGPPLYDVYTARDPAEDQTIAAAVMMVEGSLLTLVLFGWLFLRAAREGEERQALLDLAAARGVPLDERRAARAVAAGRGAELRERLETNA